MEKAEKIVSLSEKESEIVRSVVLDSESETVEESFYDGFALKGIRVDRIESQPGLLICSFTVPSRLTDATGKLSSGAIANIVDVVGSAAILACGHPWKVSVDMSISYLSSANVNDELEIIAEVLGHKGGYSASSVLLRKRATGDVVAEGRHSLFGKIASKI